MSNQKQLKSGRFAGLKVTEDFINKTRILKDRHSFKSDTELIETAIDFLNLSSDEDFKDMKLSDFKNLFFKIKKV